MITVLGETFGVTPKNLFSIAFETVLSLHPENADITLRPHPGLLNRIPSLYEETTLTTVIKVEEAQRDTPHHQGKVVAVVSIRPLKDEETRFTIDLIQESDHIPNEQQDAVLICFTRIRIIPQNGFDRAEFFRDWANQILLSVAPTQAARGEASRTGNETRPRLGELTANHVEEGHTGIKLDKESKRNRILGLRIDYLIIGMILGILISGVSLFLFPDWARSNLTLVILFPIAFAAATSFIASFRKAYE